MNSIILSDDDFSSILDGNHETFKEIESKLIDVDDHGDSRSGTKRRAKNYG
jgi:hypothetical protein